MGREEFFYVFWVWLVLDGIHRTDFWDWIGTGLGRGVFFFFEVSISTVDLILWIVCFLGREKQKKALTVLSCKAGIVISFSHVMCCWMKLSKM